jgi:iron complex outermembrane recepter protein
MTKNQTLSKLLATTVFCGAFGIAAPAYAQDDQDQTPQVGPVEAAQPGTSATGETPAESGGTIVVTGSRIPQPNLESASPITVVNSQEVRLTGTTRAEDLINSLPQVFAGQSSTVSNGASGTATVNLRGLGSERNLVLINGRRLVPGDPTSAAADINMIPAAMVDRVDVLTGGASSVYGADAVTGVVNFIMDTDFEGFRVDSQYSFYQHDNRVRGSVVAALNARNFGFPTGSVADGGTWDTTVAFGSSFDDGRGHVTAYAGYRHIDAVLQGRRDYSSCNLGARGTLTPGAGGVTEFTCGGSATSANGTFIAFTGTPGDDFTSTFFQLGPNRTLIPGFTPYNFGPLNYYQRPDERYTAGLFANYEVTEGIRPYLEFMFMDDRTVAQIAPSGNFGNTFSINCDNPLLSAQERSILCAPNNLLSDASGSVVGQTGDPPLAFIDPLTGLPYFRGFAQILRRNVEGGGRRDDLQHTEYRVVGGVRGDIDPVWSYDAYYQYGRTNFSETYTNDFSVTRLTRALDVITGPGGVPICRSAQPGGEDPNCVPYDIFGGGVSAAAINYLQTPGFQRGLNHESVASASVTGNLGNYGLQFPWAEEGIGLAAGVEYRKESLEFFSDIEFQTGDLAGQGAATLPVSGSFDVREAFAEVRIPIVSESFLHEFTITGGYRYSDYQNSSGGGFSTDTYKIEAQLAPVRDITFRGGYNRAVRAPTVQDLFAPNRVVLDGSTDPCAGHPITAGEAGCLAQGLHVGQVVAPNPASQYNGFIGGNPDLLPEVADTWTVGVVLQPRWIPRFALSVDWFDIQLDQAITGIGADTIIANCVASADPFFCSLIHRDQFGSLWRSSNGFIVDTTQNIGGLSTRGIDVNASYGMSIGTFGSLGFNFVGTWLDELITDAGVGADPITECAGLYGNICGTPNPEWRHQLRLSWTAPGGIGASLRWRYFSAVDIDGSAPQPALARIDAQNYFDLALTFRVGDHYSFRLGANNILDREPPLTGSQACPAGICNGNAFSQVYDALGRYIYAGVTLDF